MLGNAINEIIRLVADILHLLRAMRVVSQQILFIFFLTRAI